MKILFESRCTSSHQTPSAAAAVWAERSGVEHSICKNTRLCSQKLYCKQHQCVVVCSGDTSPTHTQPSRRGRSLIKQNTHTRTRTQYQDAHALAAMHNAANAAQLLQHCCCCCNNPSHPASATVHGGYRWVWLLLHFPLLLLQLLSAACPSSCCAVLCCCHLHHHLLLCAHHHHSLMLQSG